MKLQLIAAVQLLAGGWAAAQVGFWELPSNGTGGHAWAVNFDGSVIAGQVFPTPSGRCARWVNRVLELLPATERGLGIDASGDVIVGPGFRWSVQGGTQPLGTVPGCQDGLAEAWAVSQDGQTVAGRSVCPSPPMARLEAFRWTAATGLTLLGLPPPIEASQAYAISGDGRFIVGYMSTASVGNRAMKWSQETGYVMLPGDASVYDASFDGRVLVGLGPTRWVNDQLQILSTASGFAMAVSQDGLVIGGSTTGGEPFIWDPVHRLRNLRAVLLAFGVSTQEWTQLTLTAISGDGTVVAGYGRRANAARPWMARIPRFCYANCDDSTTGPTLNVNDFVCFLTHFAGSDLFYADCNLDAALNVDDFVCFTQKFAAGCP